jgi:hypothetical protein
MNFLLAIKKFLDDSFNSWEALKKPSLSRTLVLGLSIGFISIIFYTFNLPSLRGISFGIMLINGGASFICGFFIGFLFGIPKNHDHGNANLNLSPSTNLTDIADWLTKIVVGVGLVEIKKIPALIQSIGLFVHRQMTGCIQPNCTSSIQVMVNATIVFFGVLGLYYGYNYARLVLSPEYASADNRLRKRVDEQEKIIQDQSKQLNDIEKAQLARIINKVKLAEIQMEKTDPEFSAVLKEAAPKQITSYRDSQKGRWGGKSEVNNRVLSLESIVPSTENQDQHHLVVKVVSTQSTQPLTGSVYFVLHDSYQNSDSKMYEKVEVQNGMAVLELDSYEAFTIGAICDNGKTTLELDLNTLPNVPDVYKYII